MNEQKPIQPGDSYWYPASQPLPKWVTLEWSDFPPVAERALESEILHFKVGEIDVTVNIDISSVNRMLPVSVRFESPSVFLAKEVDGVLRLTPPSPPALEEK
jgi:hypothetical protein